MVSESPEIVDVNEKHHRLLKGLRQDVSWGPCRVYRYRKATCAPHHETATRNSDSWKVVRSLGLVCVATDGERVSDQNSDHKLHHVIKHRVQI